MRTIARVATTIFSLLSFSVLVARAEDLTGPVSTAIEKVTLDQPGTVPFHLKAGYAPSFERDKESNRTGDIEIWWESPTRWRREVKSPEFHQIVIVDGGREWQKNDGDYFPEWLRELAEAIVRPVPLPMDILLQRVKTAEVRHIGDLQTNINWSSSDGAGDAQSNGNGYLALTNKTGLLSYTGGPGWSGQYHDFKDFHGRIVAYTVASGNLEVTAKISILEDLVNTPDGFFDTIAPAGDTHPIETVVLGEEELRKSLLPTKPIEWPPVADGPLEGVVWTQAVVDRTGKIHEIVPPISDNPGVKGAAEEALRAMQFQPIMRDGVPVQATGRLSLRFKTVRPAGVETLDGAGTYFERGRKANFLAAGATAPYLLRAEFQVGRSGGIQTGRYEDTWISETEWKREAWLGFSHLVRSQVGEKHYVLTEGRDTGLLRLVMLVMEPIPAGDTMTESDWRVRRDTVDGIKAIRILRGPEGPNGELDASKSQGYWFTEIGQLVKTFTSGFEILPSSVEPYGSVLVARRIDVVKDGKIGLRIVVKEIVPADPAAPKSFEISGHEWQRAFTAEVR